MNAVFKKITAIMLCLVLLSASVIALIPESASTASAATYVTGDNPASSSYKSGIYYDNFCRVPLTGDARTDVVAVAMSQIGYQESNDPDDIDGIGTGYNNYTEYNENIWGVNALGTGFYWCASFVSWSLLQSGATDHNSSQDMVRYNRGDSEYIWREVACGTWASQLNTFGHFRYSKYHGGTYQPQTGDLIFFHWSGSSDESDADHIGIVVYSDDSYVYTVEGNTSDAEGMDDNGDGVYFKKYSLGYSCIVGYGVLPYATNPDVKKIDYSGANPTTGLYMANSSKDVHSDAACENVIAEMPRFTMFEVTSVASNGSLKATYTDSNGETVTGYVLNNSYRVVQITSTEPADNLDEVIEAARGTRYFDYTEIGLAKLRSAFDEALAVQNNADATTEERVAAAVKLQEAIDNDATKSTVVSSDADYTVSTTSATYTDDGVRLTDGIVSGGSSDSAYYTGWDNADAEIIVDLGASLPANLYRVSGAANESWGITAATGISVYASDDKAEWKEIGHSATVSKNTIDENWVTYSCEVAPNVDNNARYVKFVVRKGEMTHLWLDEVKVSYKGKAASGMVYISGINEGVAAGDAVVFTSDFGEINVADANHRYTVNLLADWDDEQGAYVVTSVTNGQGDDTPAITLESSQILICAHNWEGTGVSDPVLGSAVNSNLVASASVGDKLAFEQVDLENGVLGAAPTVIIGERQTVEPDPVRANLALNKTYVADGVYTVDGVASYPDENGVTLTDGITAPFDAKYDHAAYVGFNRGTDFYTENGYVAITVDLESEYWMDKFVLHAGSDYNSPTGIGAPEQISVFVSADGAEWTEFKTITPESDATISCNAFVIESDTSVLGRYVQFRIVGSLNWIMVAEVEAYEGEASEINPPVDDYIAGDVDGDGTVGSADYLMVKRYCFKTYDLTEDEFKRADVDKNDVVDSSDYVFVKRIAFGTYVVE